MTAAPWRAGEDCQPAARPRQRDHHARGLRTRHAGRRRAGCPAVRQPGSRGAVTAVRPTSRPTSAWADTHRQRPTVPASGGRLPSSEGMHRQTCADLFGPSDRGSSPPSDTSNSALSGGYGYACSSSGTKLQVMSMGVQLASGHWRYAHVPAGRRVSLNEQENGTGPARASGWSACSSSRTRPLRTSRSASEAGPALTTCGVGVSDPGRTGPAATAAPGRKCSGGR
jgi:hypothetical protein